VLLPDQFRESLRPVFACYDLVHGR
jgi:hypothetical protein